jgi:predicted Zn-dependent peptidase
MKSIIEEIKEFEINPSLKVITSVKPDSRSATIAICADAGACKEEKKNNGIAHALEHMLFKGTTTRNKKQIVVELERLGAYINAYTSLDSVVYHVSIAPANMDNILKVCDILLDMLINSTFPEEELIKEKDVILQELSSSKDSLEDQCSLGFYSSTYGDCYAGRDILGPEENIKSFTSNDLREFLRTKYNKIYFVAVGNIEEEKIVEKLRSKNQEFLDFFKEDPNPTQDIVKYNQELIIHSEVKDWANQAHVMMGWESVNYMDSDRYVADVISCILGGNMSSILSQKIRDDLGLVYHISSYTQYLKETGYMVVYFATFNDKVQEVCDLVNQEVGNFLNFTTEQLEDAKNYITGARIKATENNRNLAMFIGEHYLKQGSMKNVENYIAACNQVTVEDIKAYWNKYLNGKANKISKILTKEEKNPLKV